MDTSSFSGSYHVSCASDEQESTFLKRARLLRLIQIALGIITFAVAVSTIGCEAAPLHHYRRTSAFEHISLYLWPMNLDIRPTIALLACGCVIALLTLINIVIALLPSPHSQIRRSNYTATTTAIAGFITALVGVLFAIYRPRSTHPTGFTANETLHSWTCKWKSSSSGSTSSSGDTWISPPAYFARDCAVTEAGFALMCALIGLEIMLGFVAGAGVWLERSVSRQRGQERVQLEKIATMAKHQGP